MIKNKKSSISKTGRKDKSKTLSTNTKESIHDKFYDLESHINTLVWGCDVLSQFLAQVDDGNTSHADGVSWITDKLAADIIALQTHYQSIIIKD